MDGKKVIGGVLILVGVICAFYGINDLNSVSSKLWSIVGQSNTGAYTAIVLGIVVGIVGCVLIFPKQSAS
jgi:uncharacterized membrane protein YidH (DUF202 family)